MEKLADVRKQRAAAFDKFEALAVKDVLTAEEATEYDALKIEIKGFDGRAVRLVEAQELAVKTAVPVAGQDRVPAAVETDPYVNDEAAVRKGWGTSKGLAFGGVVKTLAGAGGSIYEARSAAKEHYGESHPVTKALVAGTGNAGGFIVGPDYMSDIIELLRPKAVVRGSNPRNIPMPRGTMTLPAQTSAASASYGGESKAATASQPGLGQIVATYKKMTAFVPIGNDLIRYSDPAVDAWVRDDMVKVIALREDLAFILGDGTLDSPRGFLSFANGWIAKQGGTIGNWLTTGASTLAVNAVDPANTTGGNFISSNATYTLATAAAELGGAVNRLDTANVDDSRRKWFMHPRTYNYLFNVQNSLGVYVYREELLTGKLLSYPFSKTTQIGTNYQDASSHTDCSFIFLVEMDEAILLDSMQLELAVSREASYVDASGNTVSSFQSDQTLMRAITEHDFQMRHDQSIAVIQAVRWAPAIS